MLLFAHKDFLCMHLTLASVVRFDWASAWQHGQDNNDAWYGGTGHDPIVTHINDLYNI